MQEQRALITGICGFTGRYLAAEMRSAGFRVFGTGTHAEDKAKDYFPVNIEDGLALAEVIARVKPHVVVHLAAIAFVAHADSNAFYRVNLLGTRHLLQAIAEHAPKIQCVLLASSANVYGDASQGLIPESACPNPVNDYAVSKLAMEYAARLWMDKLPIVIVRPFNYTGVGQDERFVIPKIIAHFRHRKPFIELGNLNVFREYNDVRWVAKAYRRLIERCPAGETVNLCTGQIHSLQEVLALATEVSGHAPEVRVNPALVRAHEVRVLGGDNTKLTQLIGELDCPPLRETLEWMMRAGT